jgi:SSS family solute:Na+ symporter
MVPGFSYDQGTFFWVINNIFFQYYSLLIFLVSATVMVVVSYMSERPSYEKISGLTFGTLSDDHKKETRASWTAGDVIGSVLVLALILAAYLTFTG